MFEFILIVSLFILVVSYKKGKVHYISVALWLLYPIYEIWLQLNCSGECNIRVDLLIIYPVILVFTVASLVKIITSKRRDGGISGVR